MTDSEPTRSPQVLNIPNQITIVRMGLAITFFVVVPFGWYGAGLVLFSIAAATDWVDGYWARKYGQVTKLGRILDPFADKLIICGAFISLCAVTGSGILPWMAIVVVSRELLVTTLRALIEGKGGDFSANMAGKLKMVFQCAAVILSLVALMFGENQTTTWYGAHLSPAGLMVSLNFFVWLSVISTIQSGIGYLKPAIEQLRG